jgi:hypothetical protein
LSPLPIWTSTSWVELGYYKTNRSSCRHFVRAIVEQGMVTDLRMEPCSNEETEPKSPEWERLIRIAREHVAPDGEPFRPPMPVEYFMPNAALINDETSPCIEICSFNYCIWCCDFGPFGFLCSDRPVIIDTTDI